MTIKLSDVCLCAIVRDEEMNPAGGIEDFVNCTVPFVESAVIVDTGSIDKTRAILEDAKAKYPNLEVYDHKFNGFANARNFSLRKGRKFSKYALVLDADERLFEEDFKNLGDEIEATKKLRGYNIPIKKVRPEYVSSAEYHPHNPRLFKNSGLIRYRGNLWEIPMDLFFMVAADRKDVQEVELAVSIKHFLPEPYANIRKSVELYDPMANKLVFKRPSECSSFEMWKQLNPRRADYK